MVTEVPMVAIMVPSEVITVVPLEIQIMESILVQVGQTMIILLRINLLAHHLADLTLAVLHQVSVDLAAVVVLAQEAVLAVLEILQTQVAAAEVSVVAVMENPEVVVTDKSLYFRQEFNLGI